MYLALWIRGLDLGQYEKRFRDDKIDASVVDRGRP